MSEHIQAFIDSCLSQAAHCRRQAARASREKFEFWEGYAEERHKVASLYEGAAREYRLGDLAGPSRLALQTRGLA